jgi:hypothetical protein
MGDPPTDWFFDLYESYLYEKTLSPKNTVIVFEKWYDFLQK